MVLQFSGRHSIVGSVVECSPATGAAQVWFPDDAPIVIRWLSYVEFYMASQSILTCKMPSDPPNSIAGHADLLMSGEHQCMISKIKMHEIQNAWSKENSWI